MTEIIQFGSNKTVKVRGEKIDGILFHIKAQTAADVVADIADLNRISLHIEVFRKGLPKSKDICNGYLDDILAAITANSTRYDIFIEKRSDGYTLVIGFNGVLELQKGDEMHIQCKAQNTAFTSLSTSRSEIEVETSPSNGVPSKVAVIDAVPYTAGEVKIEQNLGDNVIKAVMCHDFTADYDTSTEAKPVNGITIDAQGYNKDVSENLLVLENNLAIQYNPDSSVRHLTIYEGEPLNNVKVRANLSKAVTADAKIMVLRQETV